MMKGLSVRQFQVGGFDKNFSYLVIDTKNKTAALIDPCGDIDQVLEVLEQEKLTLTAILVTHTHPDHIEKIDRVEPYNTPIYAHTNAAGRIDTDLIQLVADGDKISIGEHTILVIHTPGHRDDSICFYIRKADAEDGAPKIITGDTLFVERCGKTNPNDVGDLWESLGRLMELPDETEIFSGHDYGSVPVSTIGREKQVNKYLLAPDLKTFKALRLS